MSETLINANDFSAVDGCDVFDLQMYRELGLDLTSLEDSSSEAVMPQLRVAAANLVEAQAMEAAATTAPADVDVAVVPDKGKRSAEPVRFFAGEPGTGPRLAALFG